MIIGHNNQFSNQVKHGFFGRTGGISGGLFESLNCGIGSDDAAEKVMTNRQLVAREFGKELDHLCTLYQVHSPDCIIVNQKADTNDVQADAMVTDKPGLILGVLTADCGPILFEGKKTSGPSVVGVAHAGWKGAVGGVLESTLLKMQELGSPLQNIKVAIGPCIGPASYEVGQAFIDPFLEQSDENERFFKETATEGKLMFDLPGYIAQRLALAGVKNVSISGHDTYKEEQSFFSYRRKTHRDEPDYGRQISAIMIK
ncbi:MAG: peptidoglycan editing factor PgeF [Pseudomonadota bacterium]